MIIFKDFLKIIKLNQRIILWTHPRGKKLERFGANSLRFFMNHLPHVQHWEVVEFDYLTPTLLQITVLERKGDQ